MCGRRLGAGDGDHAVRVVLACEDDLSGTAVGDCVDDDPLPRELDVGDLELEVAGEETDWQVERAMPCAGASDARR